MKVPAILIGGWVAAAGAALTLSGCSASSSSESSSEEAAVPSPSAARPTRCPTADELAAAMSDPRVTQIEVVGDCRRVSISTALTGDHADLALLVCDAAGRLAYPDTAIAGITVLDETGAELATGVRDQPCAVVSA